MSKIHLAILASGSGTNAENLVNYFANHPSIGIAQIASNKTDAYVLERAKKLGVPSFTFSKSDLETGLVTQKFSERSIDYIILAGFLLKIPLGLIQDFPDRIINIHPSLLPKHGGKGMYGERVHRAVLEQKERESGISIHLVNENYDEGRILMQKKCAVYPNDTPESLAQRIHELEYHNFPKAVEEYILNGSAL